jgi:hypothetical protein
MRCQIKRSARAVIWCEEPLTISAVVLRERRRAPLDFAR